MLHKVGSTFKNHLLNIGGKKLTKRVIVFESDDWGSVRVPSKRAYRKLLDSGVPVNKNPYNRFDSLEGSDDLNALFEVLVKFKDHMGNHPILTTNFIVANPAFEKILKGNFENYHFEKFTSTYLREPRTINSWKVLQQGMSGGLIKPQFHGREHLNALAWLKLLREGNKHLTEAFQQEVFSIDVEQNSSQKRNNLMATLDHSNEDERQFAYNQLREGMDLFHELFGFKSMSFIAPCNVWDDGAEKVLAEKDVRFFQSLRGQLVPRSSSYQIRFLQQGQRSSHQLYTVRNAYFEPSTLNSYDWIGNCLAKVHAAFFWNKPAIISTHRLNYIGNLDEKNRSSNLKLFGQLVSEIIKRWPTVEFMTSDQLGLLYND